MGNKSNENPSQIVNSQNRRVGIHKKVKHKFKEFKKFKKNNIKESREFYRRINFNSSSLVNLIISIVLAFVMFVIFVTRDMITEGFVHVRHIPIVTLLLVCLLCYTTYVFGVKVEFIRKNLDEEINDNREFRVSDFQYDLILLISSISPVIYILGMIMYAWTQTWSIFKVLISVSILILFVFLFSFSLVIKKTATWEPAKIIQNYFNTFKKVISFFIKLILKILPKKWRNSIIKKYGGDTYQNKINKRSIFIYAICIVIYICYSGHIWFNIVFTNSYGIGVLDIVIFYLICWRILLAQFFILWGRAPNLITFYNGVINKDTKNIKKFNDKFKISIIEFTLFIFFLFLYLGTYLKSEDLADLRPVMENTKINRIELKKYAENWLKEKDSTSEDIYLFAGQGGGSRAGYWAAKSLTMFDAEYPKKMNNCFAISTVSGSSVGSGIFISHKKLTENKLFEGDLNDESLRDFYSRDYISLSTFRLLFWNPFHELAGLFCYMQKYLVGTVKFFVDQFNIPHNWLWGWIGRIVNLKPTVGNRNQQLINEENKAFLELFKGINDSYYYSRSPFPYVETSDLGYNQPLFIPNSFNVTKRKKSIISPVKMYENSDSSNIEDLHEDFLNILQEDSSYISLGQGINLSQLFPIFSSSTVYKGNQYYDGGIYDNSGLSTIRDIYKTLAPLRDKISQEKKIVVIYLQNSQDTSINEVNYRAFGTLNKAIYASLFRAGTNKHQKKLISEMDKYGDLFISDFTFYNSEGKKIATNRWLSEKSLDEMDSSLDKIMTRLDTLNDFKSSGRYKVPINHLFTIYFNSGKYGIAPETEIQLKKYLSKVTPVSIKLSAYTDVDGGTSKKNKSLAENRIKSVKEFLRSIFEKQKLENIEDIFKDDSILLEQGDSTFLSKQLNRKVDVKFSFYKSDSVYYNVPDN